MGLDGSHESSLGRQIAVLDSVAAHATSRTTTPGVSEHHPSAPDRDSPPAACARARAVAPGRAASAPRQARGIHKLHGAVFVHSLCARLYGANDGLAGGAWSTIGWLMLAHLRPRAPCSTCHLPKLEQVVLITGAATGIGAALRSRQHEVMIEAVENQSPDIVIVDELSNRAECNAARTIAGRGCAIVATKPTATPPQRATLHWQAALRSFDW